MKYEFRQPISKEIFETKYNLHNEPDVETIMRSISKEIASAEVDDSKRRKWEEKFYEEMISGHLIPAGRILANARTFSKMKNYNNCFTIDIEDSMEGIYDSLKEDAIISKMGGGVGFDISKIRPKDAPLSKGGESSGPISFLKVFNESAKVIHTGGHRRCLPEGTPVSAKSGVVNIENIKVGDEVLTSDGYEKVSNFFNQGKQDTIILATDNGDFECTPNHKMPVFDGIKKYIWKEAKDISPGDKIVFVGKPIEGTETNLPEFSYNKPKHSTTSRNITIPKLDENIAWLIGLIFGDGHVRLNEQKSKGLISIACSNEYDNIIDKAVEQLKRFGVNVLIKDGDGDLSNVYTHSNQLAIYLSNMKKPNENLVIPDFIWNGKISIRSAFLAGLFDADGSSKNRPINAVSTVYEDFSENVVKLFSSLGIPTKRVMSNREHLGWKNLYNINISNAVSVRSWDKLIAPFSLKYYSIRKTKGFYRSSSSDFNWKKEVFLKENIKYSSKLWSKNNKSISVSAIERILKDELSLYPVEVTGVVEGSKGIQTYDIEVENKHEFVSNGFLTHNSAHIALLDVSHPDIEEFITVKQGDTNGELTQFNISVKITDAFMKAVEKDNDWNLEFESEVYRTVKARELYDLIAENAFMHNEPGVFYSDSIEYYNNGWWAFNLDRVNPCLAKGTLVDTPNGQIKVEEIKIGDYISTLHEDGFEPVTDIEIHQNHPTYQVTFSNGYSQEATPGHVYYILEEGVVNKSKKLEDVNVGEKVLYFDGYKKESLTIESIVPSNNATVYDLYAEKSDTWITSGIVQRGCGEIVMPPYSLCCLSAINLSQFVRNPFTDEVYFDFEAYKETVKTGVRFLDNVLDKTDYPLKKIEDFSKEWRRIGLGITGLGDALAMMKISYGSNEAKGMTERIAYAHMIDSYQTSIELAIEKGAFPSCDNDKLTKSNFIKEKLPRKMQKEIRKYGMRNIALNTIAPTGTTSFSLGQNCSSGVEPIFSLGYERNIRTGRGDETTSEVVSDYAWLLYKEKFGEDSEVPEFFNTTMNIDAYDSIDMQAIWQKYIDHSISKTLNLPENTKKEDYKRLFEYAYSKGLKGFTTFNPYGSMKGVLEYSKEKKEEQIDEKGRPLTIKRVEAPKRPSDLECDIHQISVNKEKHIILIGRLNDGSIYEVFVTPNLDKEIDLGSYRYGTIRKVKRGYYQLIVQNGEEKCIVDNIGKQFNETYASLSRFISMGLRHGVDLQFIITQLQKDTSFTSFEKAVARILKKYVKEGEKVKVSSSCPVCESSNLIYKDGCPTCADCGWSKCD